MGFKTRIGKEHKDAQNQFNAKWGKQRPAYGRHFTEVDIRITSASCQQRPVVVASNSHWSSRSRLHRGESFQISIRFSTKSLPFYWMFSRLVVSSVSPRKTIFKLGQMRQMLSGPNLALAFSEKNPILFVRAKSCTCLFWQKPDSICPGSDTAT